MRILALVTICLSLLAFQDKKPEEEKPPESEKKPIVTDEFGVDKELQNKIDEAIKKGVEWLRKKQNASGEFENNFKLEEQSGKFKRGPTILALYALLKSGVPKDDPVIQNGFKFLKSNPIILSPPKGTETYILSLLILALDALHDQGEIKDSKDDKKKKPKSSDPQKVYDLQWMTQLHKCLLSNMYSYQDKARGNCIAWGYPMGKDWDNSNTQIAVLALAACTKNGIKTPKNVWFGITNHFLVAQEKEGKAVKRLVWDKTSDKMTSAEVDDIARGWGYVTKSVYDLVWKLQIDQAQKLGMETPDTDITSAYPSMTVAGVSSLVICHSELQDDNTYKKKYSKEVEKAILDGLAKIGEDFPVGDTESKIKKEIYYYTIYGLERAGVLAKVKNMGEHLWYKEGAEDLVKRQDKAGSWGKKRAVMPSMMSVSDWVTDTCFALLFLKRATIEVPVETFYKSGKGGETEAEKAKW